MQDFPSHRLNSLTTDRAFYSSRTENVAPTRFRANGEHCAQCHFMVTLHLFPGAVDQKLKCKMFDNKAENGKFLHIVIFRQMEYNTSEAGCLYRHRARHFSAAFLVAKESSPGRDKHRTPPGSPEWNGTKPLRKLSEVSREKRREIEQNTIFPNLHFRNVTV